MKMQTALLLASLGLVVSAIAGCGQLVPIEDRPCPCSGDYVCCESTGLCVAPGASCGSTDVGDDGGSDASSTADASASRTNDASLPPDPPPGTYAAPCPQTPPTAGSVCDDTSAFCEYGKYIAGDECNDTYRCGGADARFNTPNTWYLFTDFKYACDGMPPSSEVDCPADFASVPQGQACATADDTMFCAYPEGICTCTHGAQGGPQHDLEWVCPPKPVPTAPGNCPVVPPLQGMACGGADRDCDYGSCYVYDAPVRGCRAGSWGVGDPAKSCL